MTAEEFIEHLTDPVLTLRDGEVVEINAAARKLFRVDESIEGSQLEDLFATDQDLAAEYAEPMRHYPDVAGAIDGSQRHFDRSHPTIETLVDGSNPVDTDPDVGIFWETELRYYHISKSSAGPDSDLGNFVTFRDITDVKRRERDLDFLMQVISRVLRHNLRNDLTVANAYAETIAELSDDETAEMAADIKETCRKLVQTSEKARRIQTAVEADEPILHDIDRVVDDAVQDTNDKSVARLDVDVPGHSVRANPELRHAIEECLDNAIEHSDSPPAIDVDATREGRWVRLAVSDNGPGIPDSELEALIHRGESDLVHGSGAGLWLVHTIVQESDGDLTFDTEGAGTTVVMRLPAVQSGNR